MKEMLGINNRIAHRYQDSSEQDRQTKRAWQTRHFQVCFVIDRFLFFPLHLLSKINPLNPEPLTQNLNLKSSTNIERMRCVTGAKVAGTWKVFSAPSFD